MPKYREKPVEPKTVDAFQMTEENRINVECWPEWLATVAREFPSGHPNVKLLIYFGGLAHSVPIDCFVILSDEGISVVDPDVFEATYVPADQPEGGDA